MKIIHVINWLNTGGSENLLVNHICQLALQHREIENHVCVLGSAARAAPDYLERLPIKPEFLELDLDYRNPMKALRIVRALKQHFARIKPDLVHSYLWTSDFFSALAITGTSVRHVSHVLDRRGNRNDASLKERLRVKATGRLLGRRHVKHAAVSDACREHVTGLYQLQPANVFTAHNGIDPRVFGNPARQAASNDNQPVRFGTISRMVPEKGIEFLIEGFARFAKQHPDARLTIAGGGPDLEMYRSLVQKFDLAGSVDLPGRVDSALDFYRSIDVFVVPSIAAEGLPTTILEAMAAGLPIIATDVGGAREAIEQGRQGLLVEPRDPAALADAMAQMLVDRDRRIDMGKAGTLRVRDHFTIEQMTRIIVEQGYMPLLESKAR